MFKAAIGQGTISRQVVSTDCTTLLSDSLHKWLQSGGRRILQVPQTNASNLLYAFALYRNAGQRLPISATTMFSRFFADNVSFINFDDPAQPITAGPHHCSTQFVKPLPSRMVTPQVQNPLRYKGIGAIFLTGDMPHSPKPKQQRFFATMKCCTSSHRGLYPTLRAMEKTPGRSPWVSSTAMRPGEAIGLGPSQFP